MKHELYSCAFDEPAGTEAVYGFAWLQQLAEGHPDFKDINIVLDSQHTFQTLIPRFTLESARLVEDQEFHSSGRKPD